MLKCPTGVPRWTLKIQKVSSQKNSPNGQDLSSRMLPQFEQFVPMFVHENSELRPMVENCGFYNSGVYTILQQLRSYTHLFSTLFARAIGGWSNTIVIVIFVWSTQIHFCTVIIPPIQVGRWLINNQFIPSVSRSQHSFNHLFSLSYLHMRYCSGNLFFKKSFFFEILFELFFDFFGEIVLVEPAETRTSNLCGCNKNNCSEQLLVKYRSQCKDLRMSGKSLCHPVPSILFRDFFQTFMYFLIF